MPESDAGRLLALADKLDNLVGLLAVGLAPKSTSDPFGLRRNTLGIIRILVEGEISVDLRKLIERVSRDQPVKVDSETRQQVQAFATARLQNWLGETFDFKPDVVNAVLAEQAHNPYRALQGVNELATRVQGRQLGVYS